MMDHVVFHVYILYPVFMCVVVYAWGSMDINYWCPSDAEVFYHCA